MKNKKIKYWHRIIRDSENIKFHFDYTSYNYEMFIFKLHSSEIWTMVAPVS